MKKFFLTFALLALIGYTGAILTGCNSGGGETPTEQPDGGDDATGTEGDDHDGADHDHDGGEADATEGDAEGGDDAMESDSTATEGDAPAEGEGEGEADAAEGTESEG